MSFEITAMRDFCAAHQLRLYDGSLEPLHEHTWQVRVTVSAAKLDAIGLVMDFHKLERQMEQVVGPWHGRSLNEVEPFAQTNPSAENVAWVIARSLGLPQGVKLVSVEVWETAGNSAVYRP
ncbi:MAG TPA: 6-carboxytetrahydropterin synthase [Tepidisphaeraceae bacterium]|nr:6-carboxytetrahydropterin synthase [Tepidisphaeraceae bacterium]